MTSRKFYKNPIDCLIRSVQAEGVLVLTTGFFPNWARLGPHFLFSIPLFEVFRVLLGTDTI